MQKNVAKTVSHNTRQRALLAYLRLIRNFQDITRKRQFVTKSNLPLDIQVQCIVYLDAK